MRIMEKKQMAWPFPTGSSPVKPKLIKKYWPFPTRDKPATRYDDIDAMIHADANPDPLYLKAFCKKRWGTESPKVSAPALDAGDNVFNEWLKAYKSTPVLKNSSCTYGINSGEVTNTIVYETDPNGKSQNAPGAKADAGKDRVWLCLAGFSNALREVSKVTTVGANKYTPNGWKDVPDGYERYMDAFGRHLLSYGAGHRVDNGVGGTNCLHVAQMIWNLLAALELELKLKENAN